MKKENLITYHKGYSAEFGIGRCNPSTFL